MALSDQWKKTVDDGLTNPEWDEYDDLIKAQTNEYNRRFMGTPQFIVLDWQMFKAMVWVESGGPKNSAWTSRPMQIGNPGDPGYQTLLDGKEGSDLIMSDQVKMDVKGNINEPTRNIRVGIAYTLTRMLLTEIRSVDDPIDKALREHTVVAGDSFDRIASRVGTTVPSLQQLNPGTPVLRSGQKIKYRKAGLQRVITGWRPFTSSIIAQRYNVGDPDYAAKLGYVLQLFGQLQR